MQFARITVVLCLMAAAALAAPRFDRQASATRPVTPGRNRSPTPAPTTAKPSTTTAAPSAADICAGDNLSEQLVLVCAHLQTQKEQQERLDRAKAEAACIDIIQPELKSLCIDLELSKLNGGSTQERTRGTPRPVTATTPVPTRATTTTARPTTEATGIPPRGQTTQTPTKVTGSSRLVDLFGNLFGENTGSIDVDQIATDLSQRAKETFEGRIKGTPLENVDLTEVASNLNKGGISEVFGRLSSTSLNGLKPILSDTELSRPQMGGMIADFLEQRGFDVDNLGMSNTALATTFQRLMRQNAMASVMSDNTNGISSLLSNSAAGQQMANWAQQLVKIWQANSAGLMKLPKPDLAAVLEQGQTLLTASSGSATATVETSVETSVATNARGSNALGVPATTTKSPIRTILGDAPTVGRINPTILDGLITEEVKNQALANVFANVSKGLFTAG